MSQHTFRFQARRLDHLKWELEAEEWHHLLKVVRLNEGSFLELADGCGWTAQGILKKNSKIKGEIELEQEYFSPQRPRFQQVYLGIGAVKPQSVDELIPSLVELGIDGLIVFPFEGMAKSRLTEKVRDRWERIVASSAKQCKISWWPKVLWVESFEEFLIRAHEYPHRLVLDPEAPILLSEWEAVSPSGPILATIGSEKGLSSSEFLALTEAKFVGVRLEGSILRAVTASIAAATLLRHKILNDPD